MGDLQLVEGTLLVDGYNVINAWPELAALKEKDLSHSRDRLVGALGEFRALCGVEIFAVFDAHLIKGGTEQHYNVGGVHVIYTRENETADHWIERYAALQKQHPSCRGALYVTTFDYMEQRVISSLGAYRVTPTELYRELQRLQQEGKRFACPPFERDSLDSHLSGQVKQLFESWRRKKHDIR